MASQTTEQMKRALLGGYDEQGEEQTGLFGYLSAPGQYLRGGLSDVLSWLPGGVPAHGFTGRKMWGEDVLREHLGMENQPGLDMTDVLGTGMDLLVDPLNLLYGAGAIKGGLKAARMLPKLMSSAGRAESLAAAKAALGGLPAAAKANAPGLAMGLGVPYAGASLMGSNEEDSDWKDLVGMGMMTLPLALPLGMAAARRMKGKNPAAVAEARAALQQSHGKVAPENAVSYSGLGEDAWLESGVEPKVVAHKIPAYDDPRGQRSVVVDVGGRRVDIIENGDVWQARPPWFTGQGGIVTGGTLSETYGKLRKLLGLPERSSSEPDLFKVPKEHAYPESDRQRVETKIARNAVSELDKIEKSLLEARAALMSKQP